MGQRRIGGLGGLGGATVPLMGDELLAMAALNGGPQARVHHPSLRERLGNFVYDAVGGIGGLGGIQNRMREEAQIAMDFIPGLGEAMGGEESGMAIGRGDYLGGGLGLVASALGVVPVVGDVAASGVKKGIRAYHGSPHDFDKFSLEKIGTGEGAQAYGHGLYFADNEAVAREYRDALRFPRVDGVSSQSAPVARVTDDLNYQRGNVDALRKTYEGMLERGTPEAQKMARENLAVLDDVNASNPGKIYEVNINADPDDFLDWDKPLSEQPPLVQELGRTADLTGVPGRTRKMIEHWRGEYTPPEGMMVPPPSGNDLHSALTNFGNDPARNAELTNRLKEAGIPGIKYLDAGSRSAGDGSRNYVVFDDSLISIVRKYGLTAAIGAGIISAEMGRQMQEQGLL